MAENTTDDTASTAVEAPDLEATDAGGAPKHGFFVRLYTGTGAFESSVSASSGTPSAALSCWPASPVSR